MPKFSSCRAAFVAMLTAMMAPGVFASVVLNGTRVVYPEPEREVTLRLSNEGTAPALVQAWIDNGDPTATPDQSKTPFMLAPPLFRLEPRKGQTLRIIYLREPLPDDRESLFWLNVLEIPPMSAAGASAPANSLQLAIRTRIKLMFRPAGLAGNAGSAPNAVTWRFVRKDDGIRVLTAANPTPYHVTFTKVAAAVNGERYRNDAGGMAAPGETIEFAVGNLPHSADEPDQVEFTTLDDFGAAVAGTYKPKRAPATARP